jgi:hypothetical protein
MIERGTDPEVRLHDVEVSGEVDRAAVLAAIERAVAAASTAGTPTSDSVGAAVTRSVKEATRR